MSLSIIIPVYNEEETIPQVIEQVLAVSLDGMEKEIVVVNDGSSDQTAEVLQNLSTRMPSQLTIVHHEENQGKGYITEAVQKIIEFLFTELNANKLEIHTKATNVKSIGIAERCGFKKEACIREGGRTNDGEFVDMLYYGLLKREVKI